MSTMGKLFLVVGRSGVGKDSILDGARKILKDDPEFVFTRRTVTRDQDAGGEVIDAVTPERFAELDAAGGFFSRWQAHGLSYGLAANVVDQLHEGRHVLANVSRTVLKEIVGTYANSVIVEISTSSASIAARLKARNRETDADIASRLGRVVPDFPKGVDVIRIRNEDDLEDAVCQFVEAVQSAAASDLFELE